MYINLIFIIKAEKDICQKKTKIVKDVQQRCNLSPTLFNLCTYIEKALKEIFRRKLGWNGNSKYKHYVLQMILQLWHNKNRAIYTEKNE